MALLANGLIPASFRGAPFAVVADDTGGGRRIALHQYPGRDAPWAEDMGRAARTFRFRGFIVDGDVVFAGGPIQLQRALLISVLEAKGAALLTHPTLGALTVSVTRFSIGEDLGAGRMSTVDIEFVESGSRQFPSLLAASAILPAAAVCAVALAADGVRAIALANTTGAQRKDLTTTAATWSTQAVALAADATALNRLASVLPGYFGRYANGGNAGLNGARATAYSAATTVNDLVVIASAGRVSVSVAATAVGSIIAAAELAYPSALPAAVRGLLSALSAACADPADAIRLLEQMIVFVSPRPESRAAVGVAFGRMVQRAAIAEIATAAGEYQPNSRNDAAMLISRLAPLFDLVATAAADGGDDASYQAVRATRAAVVTDLRTRGATLATVRSFAPGGALPSLRLAQRYYRDATRAGQLEVQANPAHPLFMPSEFQALAA